MGNCCASNNEFVLNLAGIPRQNEVDCELSLTATKRMVSEIEQLSPMECQNHHKRRMKKSSHISRNFAQNEYFAQNPTLGTHQTVISF